MARLYADKKYHGHGIGRELMKKCIELAREQNMESVWLDVWQKNIKAIEFYKKAGFLITDTWVFILGKDRQNDYIMEMSL